MSRYIDADELCKELKKRQNAAYNWLSESRAINDIEGEVRNSAAIETFLEVRLTIDAQPTANVRENVKGEWIVSKYPYGRCSQCGAYMDIVNNEANYCCVCGADMRGGESE